MQFQLPLNRFLIAFTFQLQQKNSAWEGAIRSTGLIWSPLLTTSSRVANQLMHSSDWLPTLHSLTGISIPQESSLDGFNMWEALSNQRLGPRTEVVHNIDPKFEYTSYLLGNWKYVNGTVNSVYDTWLGDIPTQENTKADQYTREVTGSLAWKAVAKQATRQLTQLDIEGLRKQSQVVCPRLPIKYSWSKCDPLKAPCLFNIQTDPCEQVNLAKGLPSVVKYVEQSLAKAKLKVVAPRNQPADRRANPFFFENQWTFWMDLLEERANTV